VWISKKEEKLRREIARLKAERKLKGEGRKPLFHRWRRRGLIRASADFSNLVPFFESFRMHFGEKNFCKIETVDVNRIEADCTLAEADIALTNDGDVALLQLIAEIRPRKLFRLDSIFDNTTRAKLYSIVKSTDASNLGENVKILTRSSTRVRLLNSEELGQKLMEKVIFFEKFFY
jgi:hypothetical protein